MLPHLERDSRLETIQAFRVDYLEGKKKCPAHTNALDTPTKENLGEYPGIMIVKDPSTHPTQAQASACNVRETKRAQNLGDRGKPRSPLLAVLFFRRPLHLR